MNFQFSVIKLTPDLSRKYQQRTSEILIQDDH